VNWFKRALVRWAMKGCHEVIPLADGTVAVRMSKKFQEYAYAQLHRPWLDKESN
jgi:hypothetical protein